MKNKFKKQVTDWLKIPIIDLNGKKVYYPECINVF